MMVPLLPKMILRCQHKTYEKVLRDAWPYLKKETEVLGEITKRQNDSALRRVLCKIANSEPTL